MCTPWQQRHRKKLGKRLGPGPKKPQSQSIHYATASIHVVFAVVIVVVIVIIVWWPLMIKGVKLVHADTKIEPGTTMEKCRFNYIAFKSRRRCQTLSCEARVVRTGCLMSRWTPLETCLDTCVFLSMLNFCSFGKKCFFWITTIFLVSERFLGFIKFINPFHISVVLERRSGSQNILLVIVGFFQDVVQNQNHSWQSAIIANTSNRRLVLHQTKHQITSCCSSEQDYQDLHRFCIH